MMRRRVCIGLRGYPGRRSDFSAGSLAMASPGLEVLAENPPPQPSAEAVSAVSRTLEELCGIVPGEDQPSP
jgi:hypothetical protein